MKELKKILLRNLRMRFPRFRELRSITCYNISLNPNARGVQHTPSKVANLIENQRRTEDATVGA